VSIEVLNESGLDLDVTRMAALSRFVMDRMRVHPLAELCIKAVDEATIAELNEQWMEKEGPTDVLAFPMDEEVPPGGRRPDQGGRGPGAPSDAGDPPALLGDVVVCPVIAQRQARERTIPFDDELALLVVHGVLHLLDYDHAEAEEATVMRRREQELLERFRDLEEKA
jgi:probable rRNA maturation factor